MEMEVDVPTRQESDSTELAPSFYPVEDGSAVLHHDGYDVQEWRLALAHYSTLREAMGRARKELVTAGPLFRDLFWSFYKHVPMIDPIAPLTRAHEVNRQIVEQTMTTVEWRQVREAGTTGDIVAAAMATLGVAQHALEALDAATINQVNNLHELESGARALFDQAEALEELGEQATGDQAAALYEQARQARQAAEAARQAADEEANALDHSAEERADQVRRAARGGLQQAEQEIDEMAAACRAFGGGYDSDVGGGNGGLSTKEKIDLARQVGHSRRLQEIAALCGRMTRVALRVQRTKVKHPPDEITSIALGSDLAHILPSEVGLLTEPDLEDLFYLRFAEGRLMQYDLEGSERQGQGPIIVALDSSGSMAGEPEIWSKAVMLALLAIARKQKRDMAVMHFASTRELAVYEFPKGQGSYQETIACTDHFYGGGTAFEPWMERAMLLADEARYDKADVICVSDGLSYIDPQILEYWQDRRQRRGMRVYGVLIGTREGASLLASITDAMMTLDDLQADGAVLETIFSV